VKYAIVTAALVLVSTVAAFSHPPASSLTVTASVPPNCVLHSPEALDFGSVPASAFGSPLDANANVLSIACTKGAQSISIALDNGQNFNGAHRNLAGRGGRDLVAYEIFTSPDHSTAWNQVNTVSYVPSSDQPANVMMYGRILGNQQPQPGRYVDHLLAMVNF
jgi:spore coat protein U-like protein